MITYTYGKNQDYYLRLIKSQVSVLKPLYVGSSQLSLNLGKSVEYGS